MFHSGALRLGGASLGWRLTLRLGWVLSVLTNPCRVSNPSLMLKRRFCSAEMCVMRRVSVCGGRKWGEPRRGRGRAWGEQTDLRVRNGATLLSGWPRLRTR